MIYLADNKLIEYLYFFYYINIIYQYFIMYPNYTIA